MHQQFAKVLLFAVSSPSAVGVELCSTSSLRCECELVGGWNVNV